MTGSSAAVGAVSVRGASHTRGNLPNQDAVLHARDGEWFFLAVADGHGAARHHRSDRGAAFAVDIALALLRENREAIAAGDVARLAATLPAALVEGWRARVEADIRAFPLREQPGFDSLAVYGATCLAAAIGPDRTAFLQIGDGDLLVSSPTTTVDRAIPADPALVGPGTYSLCQPDAAERVQLRVFSAPHPFGRPDFVMAATDGLANSYPADADFLAVSRHLRESLRTTAMPRFLAEFEPWLAECSARGSRDDVSVAMFSSGGATRILPLPSAVGTPSPA